MNKGTWFWLLYVLCVLFWFIHWWPLTPFMFGGSAALFILVGLIGWQVFGAPIK